MKKVFFLLTGICLLFVSFSCCHYTSHQSASLLHCADSLMESRPDSSLAILKHISSPKKLPKRDYALWCLLITQACEKSGMKPKSDSLINAAVEYFSKTNDITRKAQAYYLWGKVGSSYNKERLLYEYRQQIQHTKNRLVILSIVLVLLTIVFFFAYFHIKKKSEMYKITLEKIMNQLKSLNKTGMQFKAQIEALSKEYAFYSDEQKKIQQEKDRLSKAKEEALRRMLSVSEENNQQLATYKAWYIAELEENDYLQDIIKREHLSKWNKAEWDEFMINFNKVFHQFAYRMEESYALTERELRICCLIKLGLKTSKIAEVFDLENDTISRIKGEIRDVKFPREEKKTLDKIIKMKY
ncbi:MAG: hypothetical protein WCR86_05350 [Parabacteroides sp.]